MSQLERIYQIDRMLRGRRPPSRDDILSALEVSPATFKRDLEYMRSRLRAPIVWDRETNTYRYDTNGDDSNAYSLPGLWFTADEIHSLLLMNEILEQLHTGLLRDQLQPFAKRLREILAHSPLKPADLRQRFRILHAGIRPVVPEHFRTVSQATLARRRLWIEYHTRSRDAATRRDTSPQRLIYYRDNWYLQAWCHLRNDLRIFALDSMKRVVVGRDRAREVPAEQLDAQVCEAYGIFAGPPRHVAVLRFSPIAARWVAHEKWHPDQERILHEDGSLTLKVPYSESREILMDVLRHGPDVEVISPEPLRREVIEMLKRAAARYEEAPKKAPVRVPVSAKGKAATV